MPPAPQDFFSQLPHDWVLLAPAIAAVVLALVLVPLLRRRWRKRALKKAPAKPALPEPAVKPRIELPPSQAEAARKEIQQLARERRERAQAAEAAADTAERARLEAEVAELREREEQAKREEYRAKKAAEREAKERHQREREEEERLRQEAERRAVEEEEERRRAAREQERRRIEAQGGQTLAQGLDKTRTQGFMAKLNSFFSQPKQVDESVLAQLEEILFGADIGVQTASRLVERARERVKVNDLSSADKIKSVIREEVERMVDLPLPSSLRGGGPPHVMMVVGVNGSGKTTTIGKLAAKVSEQGRKVVLAAGDTFRAAAAEQLDVWAERAHAELIKGPENSDPGAVVFEAMKRAREDKADVVIADTAGRLHTKVPLMDELKKVHRVMGKALPGAPHEVLLVLDATTGQNAIAQAKQFKDVVGVTAIALTKIDGTAKGGVIIGICDELKIPIAWVGVGEKIADLRPFSAHEFVTALFDGQPVS